MNGRLLRFLAYLLPWRRPKGVDLESYALLRIGRATKKPSHYRDVKPAGERERLERAFLDLARFREDGDPARQRSLSAVDMRIPGPGGEIPLRLYAPPNPQELMIFLHGGGWVVGSIETEEFFSRILAYRFDAAVVSVEYRRAPENRFPAGLNDALTVLQWAKSRAREIGVEESEISICGTSAGANLATAACLKARDRNLFLPARQLLFFPVTDVTTLDTGSYKAFGNKKLGLSRAQVDWFRTMYVADASNYSDPYVSPLRAEDLHGLPPAMVVSAEFDVLRDEAELYAARLREAGVKVELVRAAGMVHAFNLFIGVLDSVDIAFDGIVDVYVHFRDTAATPSSQSGSPIHTP